MSIALIIIVAVFIVGIAFLIGAVKIVRPYQRGLVERLGRYKATRDPGFNLIMPFIERMQLVDMREQVVDVPPQEVITEDNVVVSVDAVVYYEATDPQRLIYNVADFFTAITKLAQTNLRNLIGDLELDKALTSRDRINAQLREVLDDATDKWGVQVVRVEIQRIDPPPEVVSAMHAQMRAERDRRATVTEARGFQEAAIARADGEKQSSILAAEGRRQAAILDAEGEAQAIELRARAERLRLEQIGEGEGAAANSRLSGIKSANADASVLTVEYLSALERIGDGRATKLVIPVEFAGLLGTVQRARRGGARRHRRRRTSAAWRTPRTRRERPRARRAATRAAADERSPMPRVLVGIRTRGARPAALVGRDGLDRDVPPTAHGRRTVPRRLDGERRAGAGGASRAASTAGRCPRSEMEAVVAEVRKVVACRSRSVGRGVPAAGDDRGAAAPTARDRVRQSLPPLDEDPGRRRGRRTGGLGGVQRRRRGHALRVARRSHRRA